jgi:two-component system cell cycle sensor histidine kinase/response regulator CckA
MEGQPLEKALASIVDAIRKVSPTDRSIAIVRSSLDRRLGALVRAIDDLLRRNREALEGFRAAHEAMRKLVRAEGPAGGDFSAERSQLMDALEENLPDKVYFKDLQGRFLDVSSSYARLFNLRSPSELIGKTDFDLFTEEHAKDAFEDEQRIIRTGKPLVNKEEKETWPDRPDTWVLTTKMPLRNRDGVVVGTFGISRDITERKRIEEALKKSELRYRLLFNSINDGVLVHRITPDGLPGRIIEVNDIACERLGYSREELLGMSPLDFDAPDGAAVAPAMMVLLRKNRHALWEGAHISKKGVRIPVEINSHLFDMEGEPTILATVRDITGRKALEEDLRRERSLLLILIENLPDYVSVKDLESRFLLTNAANARVLRLQEAQEAVGKTDFDFYPAAEAARYRKDEKAVIHRRWTLTTKVPLRDASGRITGVVCTGRDITELRRAQERMEDLARLSDENPHPVMRVSPQGAVLYQNNASRSRFASMLGGPGGTVPRRLMAELGSAWASGVNREIEVREDDRVFLVTIAPIRSRGYINLYGKDVTEEKSLAERFLQSQKMEAVGRLAGGIAHDFNNLLTVIGGYCELAREALSEGSMVRRQVEEIARAAKKAAALTSQLLAFSRKQVLLPRVIDPNALLRSMENILSRLIGEDIELRTFLQPDVGLVKADPVQMEQVLMNLVANARDAMPHGGTLTVETSNRRLDAQYASEHAGVRAGEYVQITVSDTGKGIPPEILPHLFEPFFTTKEQGKGTGLGLSTVYGIVKQSDGHVTCCSEPGKGTTFAIHLPRTAEEQEPAAVPDQWQAELRGTETILLVEDEEMVRRYTQRMLEENGYTVIAAANGQEAMAVMAARHGDVALLLTDVVMPGMSGAELAKELGQRYPGIGVLFVSGYTGNAVVQNGMLDPGIDLIQKPFTSRELLSKLREILGASRP